MGTVSEGVYTQPNGNFSCPLLAEPLGLDTLPAITDAYRVTRTQTIPLAQRAPGDWKANRVVSDETLPSRRVQFEYASGAVIEITSGRRLHPVEMTLADGMGRGHSWLFDRQERAFASGRMHSGLMLVPWQEEGETYRGINLAESYRQGQGPDAQLWIRNNLVMGEILHVINIQLPAAPLLGSDVHPRDLSAIRDYVVSRPDLQEALFSQAQAWLTSCHFSGEVQ
ncbi:hypothetical protein [Marinospirillum perlucidum]|uniref:hypothetical protein n=1 Tax=Marinospirillum perlucidum TaxID=1982602 RepID=UPI00138FB333|nr:hypothetical protein [Marinospirillum perlucidum]